jgi:hypothetical protein
MGIECSKLGGEEDARRIIVGTPERKRSLGRPRHKWRTIVSWILEKMYEVYRLD